MAQIEPLASGIPYMVSRAQRAPLTRGSRSAARGAHHTGPLQVCVKAVLAIQPNSDSETSLTPRRGPCLAAAPAQVGVGNHEAGLCRKGASRDPTGEDPYSPSW
jgi:hypothetical protein